MRLRSKNLGIHVATSSCPCTQIHKYTHTFIQTRTHADTGRGVVVGNYHHLLLVVGNCCSIVNPFRPAVAVQLSILLDRRANLFFQAYTRETQSGCGGGGDDKRALSRSRVTTYTCLWVSHKLAQY